MGAAVSQLIGLGMPPALSKAVGNTVQTLAGVGTAQSGAKAVQVNVALLTTSGGATAFVLSDAWSIGDQVMVVNTSATAALIYPQSGAAIDAGSTDASVSIAQNESRTFTKTTATTWRSGEAVASITTLAVSGNATVGGTLGVTGALTAASGSVTGGLTSRSATAVPASAGALAAGAALSMFSTNISVWVTSDAPSFSATKGDLCINTGGSSSSTRLFVNNGTTNWVAITTAS